MKPKPKAADHSLQTPKVENDSNKKQLQEAHTEGEGVLASKETLSNIVSKNIDLEVIASERRNVNTPSTSTTPEEGATLKSIVYLTVYFSQVEKEIETIENRFAGSDEAKGRLQKVLAEMLNAGVAIPADLTLRAFRALDAKGFESLSKGRKGNKLRPEEQGRRHMIAAILWALAELQGRGTKKNFYSAMKTIVLKSGARKTDPKGEAKQWVEVAKESGAVALCKELLQGYFDLEEIQRFNFPTTQKQYVDFVEKLLARKKEEPLQDDFFNIETIYDTTCRD